MAKKPIPADPALALGSLGDLLRDRAPSAAPAPSRGAAARRP
jgi:hypothetical protein